MHGAKATPNKMEWNVTREGFLIPTKQVHTHQLYPSIKHGRCWTILEGKGENTPPHTHTHTQKKNAWPHLGEKETVSVP